MKKVLSVLLIAIALMSFGMASEVSDEVVSVSVDEHSHSEESNVGPGYPLCHQWVGAATCADGSRLYTCYLCELAMWMPCGPQC